MEEPNKKCIITEQDLSGVTTFDNPDDTFILVEIRTQETLRLTN